MTTIEVLIKKLEEEYPNKATVLSNMNEIERERYLAKLEMIEYIKLLNKGEK